MFVSFLTGLEDKRSQEIRFCIAIYPKVLIVHEAERNTGSSGSQDPRGF